MNESSDADTLLEGTEGINIEEILQGEEGNQDAPLGSLDVRLHQEDSGAPTASSSSSPPASPSPPEPSAATWVTGSRTFARLAAVTCTEGAD